VLNLVLHKVTTGP